MKKRLIIVFVAILFTFVLTACGNTNTDDNNINTSKLINCSALITSADVGDVLGVNMLNNADDIVDLKDELGGFSKCVYNSEAYMYQIFLYQDALLSERVLENANTEWVFRNLVEGYKDNKDWQNHIIPVEGIGEEAYLTDMTGREMWTLSVLQSGYRIDMIITYNPAKHEPYDGENEWKVEKLKELGIIAVNRLKNIIQ